MRVAIPASVLTLEMRGCLDEIGDAAPLTEFRSRLSRLGTCGVRVVPREQGSYGGR